MIKKDIAALAEGIVPAIKDIMELKFASLKEKIKELEERSPLKGDSGVGLAGAMINRSGELVITLSDGKLENLGLVVGKDASFDEVESFINKKLEEFAAPELDVQIVKSIVDEIVSDKVASIELPEIDVDAIKEAILAAIPEVVNGTDGENGKDGRDGKDADPEAVKSLVEQIVIEKVASIELPTVDTDAIKQAVLAAIPTPENGKDGRDGKDGESVSEEVVKSLVSKIVSEEIAAVELPTVNTDAIKQAVLSAIPTPENGKDGRDGVDGKDVDPEVVRSLVDTIVTDKVASIELPTVDTEAIKEAVLAAIPTPENGKDGRDGVDGESVSEEVVKIILDELVTTKIAAIPTPENGKDGRDGVDGKDADPETVKSIVDSIVSEKIASIELPTVDTEAIKEAVLAAIPTPENGKDGVDGKNADPDVIKSLVEQLVTDRVSAIKLPEVDIEAIKQAVIVAIPTPENGKDGRDGENVSEEVIKTIVDKIVTDKVATIELPTIDTEAIKSSILESIPTPINGKDGRDGKDGKDGVNGKNADPATVKSLVQDIVSEKIASIELPTVDTDAIKQAVLAAIPTPENGKDGKDGKDGHDGIDGKDVDLETVKSLVSATVDDKVATIELPTFDMDAIKQAVLAAIPMPENGKDGVNGKDVDPEAVKSLVETIVTEKISSVELPTIDVEAIKSAVLSSIPTPVNGKDGMDGADGKDADPEVVKSLIETIVTEKISAIEIPKIDTDKIKEEVLAGIPTPINGIDGRDGKDVSEEVVKSLVEKLVTETVASIELPTVDMDAIKQAVLAAIPTPENGKDGIDGKDGESVSEEVVKAFVEKLVTETVASIELPTVDTDAIKQAVLAAIPMPENGKDGVNGKDGRDGKDIDLEIVKSLVDKTVSEKINDLEIPIIDVESIKSAVLDAIPTPVDGKDGKDADLNQIKSFIEETVIERVSAVELPEVEVDVEAIKEAVLAAIPMPENGKDGRDGVDGKDVDPSVVKQLIADAVSEIPSVKDGTDGRDAIDLEILPEIDLNATYVRNSYAEHNGGLWRSFEKTKGLKGWSCIVDGIKSIDIVQSDDPRSFSIKIERSSGIVDEKAFSMPVVLDTGVYSENKIYQKGDGATYGGSFWIAQEETLSKPSTDKTWRLAVKAGRNGKEVVKSAIEKKPFKLL